MRYSRLLRWVVVVAVLALGLAAAADVVALQVAESRAAAGFAQATAAERAAVSLGGFPFLPRLLAGRIVEIEVRATGMSGAELKVARVEARVQGVRFSVGAAVALIRSPHASRTRVVTGPAVGQAEITEIDLRSFLQAKIASLHDLRITPSGIEARLVVNEETGELAEPIRLLPRIENRRLVLRLVGEADIPHELRDAVRPSVERPIDLPPIPEGLTVDTSLGDGTLTLEASAPRLALLVGESGVRSALSPRSVA